MNSWSSALALFVLKPLRADDRERLKVAKGRMSRADRPQGFPRAARPNRPIIGER